MCLLAHWDVPNDLSWWGSLHRAFPVWRSKQWHLTDWPSRSALLSWTMIHLRDTTPAGTEQQQTVKAAVQPGSNCPATGRNPSYLLEILQLPYNTLKKFQDSISFSTPQGKLAQQNDINIKYPSCFLLSLHQAFRNKAEILALTLRTWPPRASSSWQDSSSYMYKTIIFKKKTWKYI